ncbi:MAG: hypothetical protein L3J95_01000 [Thermoplasmata archaeon]|nr:hypothetical protein [Thermoplasmata archaeon]MCI4358995.1 hypothetical protein [Thermoplasmata archaeon]
MSALTRGTGCGIVLGLALVLLGQQFGFVDLSRLTASIEYLVLGAIVMGVLGAIIGWRLGRGHRPPAPSKNAA